MAPNCIRIATRQSPLALWQARYIQEKLQALHPDLHIELLPMVTQGDIMLDTPLAKVGGKGLFVKELESALLEKRADIAVHSMKDLPIHLPDGLTLAAICTRADPRDAFVSNHYQHLDELPAGSIIGTSSLRRQCQLRAYRPDLHIHDLRGNVGTRLTKLDHDHYQGIILAAAGLHRLQLSHRIRSVLPVEISLPAIGQGAIGVECRLEDKATLNRLLPLHDEHTAACIIAERAMNIRLEGGCQVPIGGYACYEQNTLWLRGLVGAIDGSQILRAECRGDKTQAAALGTALAEELLAQGADSLLCYSNPQPDIL